MRPNQILLSLVRPTIFCLILASATFVFGQATSFTYQGRLNDGGTPANGNYDLEFRLFDVQSGGTALATQQQLNVAVSAGVFTVTLDFGASFTGGQRFLEIGVRPAGGSSFITLNPRQPITSTPYAIRSLNAGAADTATNAMQLGGAAANQYVLTGDARLSDARNPLPGSSNYIQNQNAAPQASSNFNISGSGTVGGNLSANAVNATTQFNINGNRILSLPSGNLLLGTGLGQFLTSGAENTFIGTAAGNLTNTGSFNTFVGGSAGAATQSGQANSFFGIQAGFQNTIGSNNSAFGAGANMSSASLINATAIGARAQVSQSNSLILGSINNVNGATANTNIGIGTTAPAERLHVVGNGLFSGNLTVGGTLNATLPAGSGNYIQNTTAQQASSSFNISGNGTIAGTLSAGTLSAGTGFVSNSLQVGPTSTFARLSVTALNGLGVKGIVTSPSTVFGDSYVGKTALWGTSTIDVGVFGTSDQYAGVAGSSNSHFGVWGRANVGYGGSFDSNSGTGVYAHSTSGFGLWARSEQTHAIYAEGSVRFTRWLVLDELKPGTGAISVCRNSSNELSFCSSSLRYKENIDRFVSGLDLVRKLRPITFDWKGSEKHDLGLAAEDVEKIEPLLVTYNKDGQVEGVKYDRIGVVLINAVKEQQAQIQKQQEQLEEQQKQIAALKNLLCRSHRRARPCR
jgi:endosialidase-like protein